jgi:hypothetical protein
MPASKPRHILASTLIAITSSEQNDRQSLHHAALMTLGAAVLQGDSPVYGVVQGGTVSATGADLNVTVAPLLALRLSTAPSSYDSAVAWIELVAASTQSLAAHVDGANPRWVVIEIAEGQAPEAQVQVPRFNTVTKFPDTVLVDRVVRPVPVITVRAGTAAANPVFPAGVAGVIPLAYVYLEAGATDINITDIVMCRPMLRGDGGGDQSAGQREVWGGGVSVTVAGQDVVLRNVGGRFASHRTRWSLQATAGTTTYAVAAPGCDGNALPVADDVVYFYACPAPYPAGYDANLAPREHRPGTTALTRYQGLGCTGLYDAVIVASTVEPQLDTPQGNPVAGDFEITCAPFSAVGTPVDIDRTTAVYLGAASWDVSATDFLPQSLRGDVVVPGNEVASANIVTGGTGNYNIWGTGLGLMLYPVTARLVHAMISLSDADTPDGTGMVLVVDDSLPGTSWRFALPLATVAGSLVTHTPITLMPDSSGVVAVSTVTGAAFDDARIRSKAYEDAILALR